MIIIYINIFLLFFSFGDRTIFITDKKINKPHEYRDVTWCGGWFISIFVCGRNNIEFYYRGWRITESLSSIDYPCGVYLLSDRRYVRSLGFSYSNGIRCLAPGIFFLCLSPSFDNDFFLFALSRCYCAINFHISSEILNGFLTWAEPGWISMKIK